MAREHLRAFQDVPGVAIAGLYSRTRSRADALAGAHGVAIVCDSVPELYERTRADLVVIAVNVIEQASVRRACFEFAWTVLVKSLSDTILKRLKRFSKPPHRRRKVLVALNRRFLSSTRAAFWQILKRRVRAISMCRISRAWNRRQTLGHPRVVVDNWMYANSIHVIDYLRAFGRGSVTRVTPIIPWNFDRPGVGVG